MKGGPRYKPTSLNVMVKGVELGMWPTPNARDHKDTGQNVDWEKVAKKSKLAGAVMWPTPTANRRDGLQSHGVNIVSGSLNPNWVEWLMGYPVGWTDLGDSVTQSSRKSLKRSGE